MQALAEYAKALAIFMVFSALVDIISPTSGFKKYINLIMGLMLIAIVLEPVAGVIKNSDGFLTDTYNKYKNMMDAKAINYNYQGLEQKNSDLIIKEYKERLNRQIAEIVNKQTGAHNAVCSAVVNEDGNNPEFGSILGIHITVLSLYDGHEENAVKRMVFGDQNSYPAKEQIDEGTEKLIKNCLMDFYNIDEANIHITVQ